MTGVNFEVEQITNNNNRCSGALRERDYTEMYTLQMI